MFKNSLKIVSIANALLIVVVIAYLFYNRSQLAYIDSERVFNEFAMTRDVKKMGDNQIRILKKEIDSLYVVLNDPAKKDISDSVLRAILKKEENLEHFSKQFTDEESLKIWQRINIYAKDFSQANNYNVLLSKQHNGAVLFADEQNDVSNDFIKYINAKYDGNE